MFAKCKIMLERVAGQTVIYGNVGKVLSLQSETATGDRLNRETLTLAF